MSKVYVARWDCDVCGNKGNLGPNVHCESCGNPRGKNVEFYLPENAEVVNDESKIKDAFAGADWVCSYCSSANKVGHQNCASCGNPRDVRADISLNEKEFSLDDVPTTGDDVKKKFQYTHKDNHTRKEEVVESNNSSGKVKKLAFLLGKFALGFFLFIVLLIFLAIFIKDTGETVKWEASISNYTKLYTPQEAFHHKISMIDTDDTVKILQTRWEWIADIEKLTPVKYEDWSVPSGGRTLSSYQAIRSYVSVQDGYVTKTKQVKVATGSRTYVCGKINKGNGYYVDKTCTETTYTTKTESYQEPRYVQKPVYDTKYVYEMDEWKPYKTEVTGAKDKNP